MTTIEERASRMIDSIHPLAKLTESDKIIRKRIYTDACKEQQKIDINKAINFLSNHPIIVLNGVAYFYNTDESGKYILNKKYIEKFRRAMEE